MEKSNLPRVTDILKVAGISDFSRVPIDILEAGQHFGTAVHKATELWDKGILDETILSEPLIPRLAAWKKFIKDYGVIILAKEIEKRFTSKKYGFTGEPDRWPKIQGKRTLIDLKSSTSMYPSTEIQTAGYEILLSENGIKVDRRWGIQLKENGTYNVEPYMEISDKTTFLSALNLYNWKKRKGLLCS